MRLEVITKTKLYNYHQSSIMWEIRPCFVLMGQFAFYIALRRKINRLENNFCTVAVCHVRLNVSVALNHDILFFQMN